MHTDTSADAVAIIGVGCRFAESPNPTVFWRNLLTGRDCVTRDPGRPTVDLDNGQRRVAAWALMPGREKFDASVIGADGINDLDTQHGILYESLWSAFEDASVRISAVGDRTAVYAGCARTKHVPRTAFDDVVNIDPTFAATQFSYLHDLRCESIMIDSTCATAAVAVHLACQSLRLRACDYALAGGVAVFGDADGSYAHDSRSIYSAEGICRPFDRRATGTVPGDGAGAVLLRRLSDAVTDGDPIHAVIRASAVDNDGNAKPGFTIPGIEGKVSVIRKALAAAGLTGEDIGYFEAHGVGIPMNDQIEATALTEALGPEGPPVAVGSVKASIGHCDTAAAMAALIKAAFVVRDGFLPATPNTSEPIDELSRYGGRFCIIPEGRPWISDGRPRTAGVMSAGIGGTNVCLIVEEPPATR